MALIPFDDRDGLIWLDGKLIPWRDAKVHVLTHGLHYASAVFEGERIYSGQVFKLREHSQRLIDSARMLDFELPYTVEQIDDATRQTVIAQRIVDGYVRPIAWRGSEVMGVSAQASKIHLAIAVWQWPSYFDPAQRAKGLRLDIAKWRRPSPETIPSKAKAAGLYMICTLSKHAAERQGYADALMYDYRGLIAEATGANIFFIKDGVIHTPTPDCFLDGITRQTVIDLARRRGVTVAERFIAPEVMTDFEACFITGTAAEVTPVAEIGPYSFQSSSLVLALMQDYEKEVRVARAA